MADEKQQQQESGASATAEPEGPATLPESQNPHGTLSGQPLKDLSEGAPEPPSTTERAVRQAAKTNRLPKDVQAKATRWFLDAEIGENAEEHKVLELNWGSGEDPEWKDWVIRPVDIDTMRDIRQRATNNRAARRTGQVDEYKMNLQIVVAGTYAPDISAAAAELVRQGSGPADPVELLRNKFSRKPGYVPQIAGEIMSLSGFDNDDVRESEAVDAAGNS